MIVASENIKVDLRRQTLLVEEAPVAIRPKAFALLRALIDHPFKIQTKEYLLRTIWDDVQVDEQVLFQTIRELRQLLGDAQLILTHPRKGYSWNAEVSTKQDLVTPTEPSPPCRSPSSPGFFYGLAAAGALLFSLILIAAWPNTRSLSEEGPVLVLPIKESIAGSGQEWMRVGLMDQIISQLKDAQVPLVLDTDYALAAARRAQLSGDYRTEEVSRVFVVSGASLVVESAISGSVDEYRLDYWLHFVGGTKRGSLFGKSPNTLTQQLTQRIAGYTGTPISTDPELIKTDLHRELLAQAMEFMDQALMAQASSVLHSLSLLDPHNPVVDRLLVEAYVHQGRLEEAQVQAEGALTKSSQSDEHHKLLYWRSVIAFRQGEMEIALSELDQAETTASQTKDWLYRAYAAQLRAQILMQKDQYTEAESALFKGIEYHQMIRCPLGEALTRKQLIELYARQGNLTSKKAQTLQVEKLQADHNLSAWL